MLFTPRESDGGIEALCVIDGSRLYIVEQDADACMETILKSPCKKRCNNIKYLYHFGLQRGFEPVNIVFDAEIAAYILNPTSNGYGIAKLAGEYGVTPPALDNLLGLHGELLDACAVFTPLADKLTGLIEKLGQEKLFYGIELPLARVLADMEHTGFAVDTAGLETFGARMDAEIARLQDDIYALAGGTFNINSPKQLGKVLFEDLGLPAGKKTKTKSGFSTNADVLEPLAQEYEIVAKILDYRKVAKLKSTYVEGLLRVVGPDGRIHTSFQQTLTRTGRISSVEPNMQNIPIRTELGSELRRFFRAAEGKILLDADYSQIELRVLAHIAGDENMIAAFSGGQDIHLNTAAQVFDMPPEFVTPLMRSRAKAVNFGIVYGIGAFSLSKDIGVSVSEADSYIKNYLSTYAGVKKYMDDTVAAATENGYVETLFHRRRYLPELASSNRANREFGKRVAMNTPIQGTAADIIKIAMVRVYDRLRREGLESRLILQVHDELIVESPHEEADRAAAVLHEEMEAAVSLSVPMEADVGRGATWLDAK
ncbi:MAG: DNA polymerase I, partial [Oscillospiraceae bacterium]|jgi:DNA polymerase-1|nr:DNA polymerase I [Oscillospiraceae bacterium]